MPPQYLFPCDNCNHQLIVVPRQAGQNLTCPQCQHFVEAPKLGEMKQLEMVGGTEPVNRPAASSGGLRNLLFVVGLAMAIICGATGYLVNRYASALIFEIDYDQEQKEFEEEVDHLNSAQVVALYEAMQIEKGLGEWYEPNYVRYNTQGAILRKISYGVFGLAGLGLLMLIGSFFIRR